MPVSGFKVSSGVQCKHSLNKGIEGTYTELSLLGGHSIIILHCFFQTDFHTIDLTLHEENMDNSTFTGKSGHMRTNTLRTAIRVDTIVTMVL